MNKTEINVVNQRALIAMTNSREIGEWGGNRREFSFVQKYIPTSNSNDVLVSISPSDMRTITSLLLGVLDSASLPGTTTSEFLLPENPEKKQLREIMRDFEDFDLVAHEEGIALPSIEVLNQAKRILKEIHSILPIRYEVYPTDEQSVAIEVTVKLGRGILIICENDGGAVCFVSIDEHSRRARYDSGDCLPDAFVREALYDLSNKP